MEGFYLKTFVCAILLSTIFAGCSDDNAYGTGSAPWISVNGKAEETLTVNLDGGVTQPINVVSSGEWKLAFNDKSADTWCHPRIKSDQNGSQLFFEIDPSSVEREISLTLTTEGVLNGFLARAAVTLRIVQSKGIEVATNVKLIRNIVAGLATPEGTSIRKALTLTGVVVSDIEAGGTLGSKIHQMQGRELSFV